MIGVDFWRMLLCTFSKQGLTPHLTSYTPPYTFTPFLSPPTKQPFQTRQRKASGMFMVSFSSNQNPIRPCPHTFKTSIQQTRLHANRPKMQPKDISEMISKKANWNATSETTPGYIRVWRRLFKTGLWKDNTNFMERLQYALNKIDKLEKEVKALKGKGKGKSDSG